MIGSLLRNGASVTGIDVRSLMQVKRWQQQYRLWKSDYRQESSSRLMD
jgi:2-polyprenyl-3-methyl-5-hydroxy-6-metoxy-1,4-benzoquinol methylase